MLTHLAGLEGVGDGQLGQVLDYHAALDVLADLEPSRAAVEKIEDLLVVDLEERACHERLQLVAVLLRLAIHHAKNVLKAAGLWARKCKNGTRR